MPKSIQERVRASLEKKARDEQRAADRKHDSAMRAAERIDVDYEKGVAAFERDGFLPKGASEGVALMTYQEQLDQDIFGEPDEFSYLLGVHASQGDAIDYRAMLARCEKRRRVPQFPTWAFVALEMATQETFRARWERVEGICGCYEWLISKGADGREYA
jgi:hypothetical protein